MSIIDLTEDFPAAAAGKIRLKEAPLHSAKTQYTGRVYDFPVNSMDGSYLDFPGHIRETDDGMDAGNAPPEDFYRIPCSVIHLSRECGAVTAGELEEAFGAVPATPALLINALGAREDYELEKRSVWLDFSALDWIIGSGVRLLVSDIYESQALEGVFLKLFQAGVTTVCEPRRMNLIHAREVLLTVLFLKITGVTQIPCRILAEIPDNAAG